MPTGPFDRRSKRSRCSACSSSHLKCDGADPCNHCHRRNIPCTYQKASLFIKVDQSRVKTVANFSKKQQVLGFITPPRALALSPTSLNRHLFYFDNFARRNNFVANTRSYDFDVKVLMGAEPGHYLVHAVTALGALQSSRLSPATSQDDSRAAMKAYSSSVVALREAMSQLTTPSRLHVLWTTLLLGLFELMQSESEDGWLVHMVHGTGAALQASGPSSCMSGPVQSFFIQARVFEVSRALLLGESTFLSRPEWSAVSRSVRIDEGGGIQTMDKLLDIIVQCSNLRVRTGELIETSTKEPRDDQPAGAQVLAMEGLQLRIALDDWRTSSARDWGDMSLKATPYERNLVTLSNIFFAAISIYLSGVYDYEVIWWRSWGLSIPTLGEEQVQRHVQTILELTTYALRHTSISPLLFLFSLRIAGARSYDVQRQRQVLDLLTNIGEQFTVARIFRTELQEVWRQRAAAMS